MGCLLSADTVLSSKNQQGECETFDQIVARYKEGIYNYIWRMVSNRDDVEDLTQEVFVRAFGSFKSFRRDSNPKTWLYRIATNLCIDRYRRKELETRLVRSLEQNHLGEDDETTPTDIPDTRFDPAQAYERSELQAEVQRALSLLPDKLRSTILLYDIEGMSYEEIAEALGCPIGTVKSRLFNARMQLRKLLKPYFENNVET